MLLLVWCISETAIPTHQRLSIRQLGHDGTAMTLKMMEAGSGEGRLGTELRERHLAITCLHWHQSPGPFPAPKSSWLRRQKSQRKKHRPEAVAWAAAVAGMPSYSKSTCSTSPVAHRHPWANVQLPCQIPGTRGWVRGRDAKATVVFKQTADCML